MDWDRLPPTRIEDCRHRSAAGPDGSAVCSLLARAGVPREGCGVRPGACSACLAEFPPAPDCWNTVVVSLVYARSLRALESASLAPGERASLVELKEKAALLLPVLDGPAAPPEPTR